MVYEDYFKSKQWELTKKLRLEVDNGECVLCKNTIGVDVYHKTVERIGQESIYDLITLCEACYKKYIELQNEEPDRGKEWNVEKYYGHLIVENPLLVSGALFLDGEYVTPMRGRSRISIKNLEVGEYSLCFRYKMNSIKYDVVISEGETTEKKLLIPRKFEKNYIEDLEYELLEICMMKTPDYGRLKEILSVDGFNINIKTDYGEESPLYLAVRSGNLELVSFLTENGTDVNMPNIKKRTPIMVACATGNYEIFKYLLENGAKLGVVDVCGDNLLIKAISSEKRDFEIFKTLIKMGENINYRNDKDGDTALTRALKLAPDRYVDYLLESGADIFIEDKSGMNPLDIVVQENRSRYFRIFLERGLRPSKRHTLIQLAKKNLFELLKEVVNEGADVNMCENTGSTALIEAVKLGNLAMVEFLMENGASLDIEDEKGETAIYYSESKDIIEKLVNGGSDVNHKNIYGKTALDKFLEKYMSRDGIEVLKLYLKKGAKI